MSDESVGSGKRKATPQKRNATAKLAAVGNIYTSYEVKSKGYQETFSSMDEANKQVDILRKRAVKNQDAVSIKVYAKKQDDEKQHVVRSVKIGKDFFDN